MYKELKSIARTLKVNVEKILLLCLHCSFKELSLSIHFAIFKSSTNFVAFFSEVIFFFLEKIPIFSHS